MCEKCQEERDEDYEGSSVEEKRTKAARSIVERHPELGLAPEEISVRFVPKAEERCIRAEKNEERTYFEIHLPSYTAVVMSRRPPLDEIAMAASIKTGSKYEDMCGILGRKPQQRYNTFYVADTAPIDPARADSADRVRQYEEQIAGQGED